jgi:fatty acid desaturase
MLNETAPEALRSSPEDERLRSFGRALDTLRREVESQVGAEDLAYIERIQRISSALEVAGRTLIHFSFEPVAFGLGVSALWAHKSLELMELGHMALHGCYDANPEATHFHSGTFHWKAPIDEKYWRRGHNVRHHQYTNVEGRDPDLNFAVVRLSARVPYRAIHVFQPVSNFLTWLNFAHAINMHVTGVLERYARSPNDPPEHEDTKEEARAGDKAYLKKLVRYYGREYVFFPMLAGPFFLKTLVGNALAEMGRDVFAGAVIYCGHVGAKDYPRGTQPRSRAQWYKMQAEGARNVAVPRLLSILTGALDRQIEHHLFPAMPPNRLREVSPRVKQICEEHGVTYLEKGWPETLREVFGELRRLSSKRAEPATP